ncbi:hypothetical protein [Pikeienuella sp. HZG-20]|uniref:hypothetical protein n=1 Tax=Paludibacillus litoralis TaxID=3133267 RepID=UPI0030EC34F7
MRFSLKTLRGLVAGESGAVAVDWLALAAALVVIGVGLAYAVFGPEGDGVDELVSTVASGLTQAADEIGGAVQPTAPGLADAAGAGD